MIDFLDHPDNFAMQIRLASADKRTLCKIALIQVKKAGRISEMGNWIFNAIQSGLMAVKGMLTKAANALHSFTRMILFSNVVMKSLTSVFRNVAYQRLLGAMYDSWLLGVEDKSVNLKRTPKGVGKYLMSKVKKKKFRNAYSKGVGSFYMKDPFYEEYLMGHNGEDESQLTERAKKVVYRDIGTRTISEMAKVAFDSLNIGNTALQFMRDAMGKEAYTGRDLIHGGGSGRVKNYKSSQVTNTFLAKFLVQCVTWVALHIMGYGVFAFYSMIPLGVVGLFYYSGTEAVFQKGELSRQVYRKLSKVFKKKKLKDDYFDILDRKIPVRDVFIRNSIGGIDNPTKEDLKSIKEKTDA